MVPKVGKLKSLILLNHIETVVLTISVASTVMLINRIAFFEERRDFVNELIADLSFQHPI
jgi:hypothetical protein